MFFVSKKRARIGGAMVLVYLMLISSLVLSFRADKRAYRAIWIFSILALLLSFVLLLCHSTSAAEIYL